MKLCHSFNELCSFQMNHVLMYCQCELCTFSLSVSQLLWFALRSQWHTGCSITLIGYCRLPLPEMSGGSIMTTREGIGGSSLMGGSGHWRWLNGITIPIFLWESIIPIKMKEADELVSGHLQEWLKMVAQVIKYKEETIWLKGEKWTMRKLTRKIY